MESTPVFRGGDWAVFVALTGLNAAALTALFRYWGSLGLAAWTPISVLVGALLLAGLLLWWVRWLGLPLMRRPVALAPEAGLRVAVATTFVPGAEPFEMLEETVMALVSMRYPHETWVLDEGDDPGVKGMCDRYGVRHFTRHGSEKYNAESGRFARATKYGNYNAWLTETDLASYDVVVAFDPDHVPRPHFLERVLGYFRDPEVAYVQAPQVYDNQKAGFIARGAAEETYAYYSSLQMTSFALGYPIITGCHNAHRATALRDIGGFPAHEADDLLMTMEYRAAGQRGIYVPELLAAGITPVDWNGYLRQQRRWARSVLDVKVHCLPHLWRRLSPAARLASAVHGLHYLYAMTTAAGIVLLAYLLATGDGLPILSYGTIERLLAVGVAIIIGDAYRQRFFIDRPHEWGIHWRSSFLRFAKWPSLIVAVWDVILPRHRPYLLTLKVPTRGRGMAYVVPHAGVAVVLILCWSIGQIRGVEPNVGVLVLAGLVAAVSLSIFLSGLRRFPPPYDPELRTQVQQLTAAPASD